MCTAEWHCIVVAHRLKVKMRGDKYGWREIKGCGPANGGWMETMEIGLIDQGSSRLRANSVDRKAITLHGEVFKHG